MPAPELSSSPTDTHCTHVRVGLLLLRARVRPTPARCYLPPLLPAIGRAPQARGPEGCGDPVHRHWGGSDPHAHGMREWGARA